MIQQRSPRVASSAKVTALKFLKMRSCSIGELKEKLKGKKFSSQEIEATVDYLTELKLLDDRAFTKSWITYRLARPFGFRRIYSELIQKGVAKDIINEAISQVKGQEYEEGDVALELARRRWDRLSGIDPQKRRKRVGDFLLRRGFPMDEVMKVLKKLC